MESAIIRGSYFCTFEHTYVAATFEQESGYGRAKNSAGFAALQ